MFTYKYRQNQILNSHIFLYVNGRQKSKENVHILIRSPSTNVSARTQIVARTQIDATF